MSSRRRVIEERARLAARFLRGRRSPDGLWRDFETLAGPSSEWVTSFVCYAVRGWPMLGDSVQEAVAQLFRRQRRNGGWSYSAPVPPDCDSTGWALLALSTARFPRPSSILRGVRFVLAHQDVAAGGFSTYTESDGIDRFIGVDGPQLTQGWLAPHPCVTSVATQALLVSGERACAPFVAAAVRWLLKRRGSDGLWSSYWWRCASYTTYFALRTLRMAGILDLERPASIEALRQRQRGDGSWGDETAEGQSFDTALATLALLLASSHDDRRAAARAIAWILDHQLGDGSWGSSPILRIPPPMIEDVVEEAAAGEMGTGVLIRAQTRVFTTAAVLWALSVHAATSLT